VTLNTAEPSISEHVIVCGLGNVGYRVVRLLMRLGQQGVVITREPNEDWRRAIEPQFRVIVGDARDDRLLEQAGVAGAKAVIIVTNDDLANVSIALDARRMNPRAALVVRQFDQELAIHLEQSVKIDRALSASALAAPPFLAAALGTTVRCSFPAGEAVCHVGEDNLEAMLPGERARLGAWSKATGQAALAIRRDGRVIFPRDLGTLLQPGDRVIGLRVTDGCSRAAGRRCRRAGRSSGVSPVRRFLSGCRQWWHEVPGALRKAVVALLLVVLVSVGVFHAAMGLSLVDALYFVVTTVTTVGYGDYHLMQASPWLKLYGVFLMLCGAAILAVIFSIATDLMLRTRLRDLMAHSAAHYRDHVIVAGLGNIGFRLLRDLVQAGHAVVAIEHRDDAPHLQAARELAPVVLGNAKTAETLRKAGAAGARVVVAATDDDLANLSAVLAARRIRPSCRAVLRLFNSELAEKMQQGLAMDAVLSVSAAAAPTFVAAALCPQTLHGFLLDDWLLSVFHRVAGEETCPAENQSLLFIKRAGASRYELAAGGCTPRGGDEILGVRWYPLAGKRCDR
jgi:Trk K+ transport system NAD-binding subunit